MKKLYVSISILTSVLFFCSFTTINKNDYKYRVINDSNFNLASVYGSFVEFQESKYDSDKKQWTYRRKDVVEDFENQSLSTLESVIVRN